MKPRHALRKVLAYNVSPRYLTAILGASEDEIQSARERLKVTELVTCTDRMNLAFGRTPGDGRYSAMLRVLAAAHGMVASEYIRMLLDNESARLGYGQTKRPTLDPFDVAKLIREDVATIDVGAVEPVKELDEWGFE